MTRYPSLRRVLVGCLVGALPAGLCAQDVNLPPSYGSTTLVTGFDPDPFTVEITAGGDEDASNASGECTGAIADAPDYSVEFTAGEYVLSFLVNSSVDTTLLVNDPGGEWHCNDDSADLDSSNPGILFSNPTTGRYDVWVGIYDRNNNYTSATLLVSERNESSWRDMVANLGTAAPPVYTEPTPPPPEPQQPTPMTLQPATGAIQYGRKL